MTLTAQILSGLHRRFDGECVLDTWPRTLNGALIEPLSGHVRIRRPGARPLELDLADTRQLAAAAPRGAPRTVLTQAIDEAARQGQSLHKAMEAG